jgi:uncharacterized protein (DUF58 family)
MPDPVRSRGTGPGSGRLSLVPTPALVRAGLLGVLTVALAVITGRPLLMMAGLPLLAWAVLATLRPLLSRRTQDEADDATRIDPGSVDAPVLRATSTAIAEGGTVTLAATATPGTIVTADVPLAAHADLDPPLGSAVGSEEARLTVTARRWGRYEIGPVHVVVQDVMAARRTETELGPLRLRVTPDSAMLDAPVDVPTPIGVSGVHLSHHRGDGTALADVRLFRPGDRLHRINWAVTSRTGQMHTNATFTEQDTDVLIVTDTMQEVDPLTAGALGRGLPVRPARKQGRAGASGASGAVAPDPDRSSAQDIPADATSLDLTIRATAAIARYYLGIGDRVALHDLGPQIGSLRSGSGPRQLRILTETLARAARGSDAMAHIRPVPAVHGSTLTVVCTPLLSERVVEQIGHLIARGADVIVVDTLPASVGDAGVLRGKRLGVPKGQSDNRFWPEAWALRRLLRERTVRELRERGVPVVAWEGTSSLAPVLLALAQASTAPRMTRGVG